MVDVEHGVLCMGAFVLLWFAVHTFSSMLQAFVAGAGYREGTSGLNKTLDK